MAQRYDIKFSKTYATQANAEKAVAKLLGADHERNFELRYMILPAVQPCGSLRYGVVFIGQKALEHGVHFHFNVIA